MIESMTETDTYDQNLMWANAGSYSNCMEGDLRTICYRQVEYIICFNSLEKEKKKTTALLLEFWIH